MIAEGTVRERGREGVENRKDEEDCRTAAVEACSTAEEGRSYSRKANENQSRV